MANMSISWGYCTVYIETVSTGQGTCKVVVKIDVVYTWQHMSHQSIIFSHNRIWKTAHRCWRWLLPINQVRVIDTIQYTYTRGKNETRMKCGKIWFTFVQFVRMALTFLLAQQAILMVVLSAQDKYWSWIIFFSFYEMIEFYIPPENRSRKNEIWLGKEVLWQEA